MKMKKKKRNDIVEFSFVRIEDDDIEKKKTSRTAKLRASLPSVGH